MSRRGYGIAVGLRQVSKKIHNAIEILKERYNLTGTGMLRADQDVPDGDFALDYSKAKLWVRLDDSNFVKDSITLLPESKVVLESESHDRFYNIGFNYIVQF